MSEALETRRNSHEGREQISTVTLHFMRHGEKEGDKTKSDDEIALTQNGRQQAVSKSLSKKDMSQSVAFGSPRRRTQETAALAMAGGQDMITGDEAFEELRKKIDSELGVGSKVSSDKRLDFRNDPSMPFGKRALEEFKKGEFLKFIVEQSDALAKELGDVGDSTYSRMARGVAEIVLKYEAISPQWHRLVNNPDKKYSEFLERFFGSHQGVLESFLAKLIEKTKGVGERDRFVALLGNKGFDYTEGFDIKISDNGGSGGLKTHIQYKKEVPGSAPFTFDEDISPELLKEIAAQ